MESPAEPAGATVPPKLPRPRTTRARTSGIYLADVFFVIAPASQELEPPANPVRFMAYNLANFMRTLALPKEVEHWSLTTLREKLVKIGAKVVRHGRYVTFQLAEVAVPRELFRKILGLIDDLRRRPAPA